MLTCATLFEQNLKNIGRNSLYTVQLSKSSQQFPRFWARACFNLHSYSLLPASDLPASSKLYTMYLMKVDLLSSGNSFKKICMFFRATILMSIALSFKNLSMQGRRSCSVYFGPRILASSWILAARDFLILGSLILFSLWQRDQNRGHSSGPNTRTKAGKLKEA